jgi:hypothetical protein
MGKLLETAFWTKKMRCKYNHKMKLGEICFENGR